MTEKKKISMDMDQLTFGELELFENVTGMVMSDAIKTDFVRDKNGQKVADPDDPKGRPLQETKMSARAMMGMVYLSLVRDGEDVTWEDVKKLKLSDVDFELTTEEEEGKKEETQTNSES